MNSLTTLPFESATSHDDHSVRAERKRHGTAGSLLLAVLGLVGITFLLGCESRHIAPYIYYQATLDDDLIDEIRFVIQDVTKRFDLRTDELDHSMLEKYEGERHLTAWVYYHEVAAMRHEASAMLDAGPTHMVMLFYGLDRSPMPINELDVFIYTLKRELEGRVGIDFCRADLTDRCTAESAWRDEAWEADVLRRIQAGASPRSQEDGASEVPDQ